MVRHLATILFLAISVASTAQLSYTLSYNDSSLIKRRPPVFFNCCIVRSVDQKFVVRVNWMGKVLNPIVLETMIRGEAIDFPEGNPPLRSTDKDLISDFIYGIHQLKSTDIVNSVRLSALKDKAAKIIVFLHSEYRLEDE